MRYLFTEIKSVEDILKAIGRADIPSTSVTLRRPSIDPETGEYLADLELDFGAVTLSPTDEAKLNTLMARWGLTLKRSDDTQKATA